ncbi:MAG: hypothetical protein IPP04_15730 [Saprospiraceae bacterium]|nr:hypothetical protein [Saprospiraceae bacterium]MBK9931306.1 hypothetical protein [Saprospiraceae bacterium]
MNKTALTKHQLSEQLGISLRTLQRKLHQAGLNIPRGLISIDNQHIIREKLGYTSTATHRLHTGTTD